MTNLILSLILAQVQHVNTWPPLQNVPGIIYASTEGPYAKFEPVLLGPGIAPPVKGPFGWFLNSVNIPAPTAAGFIPLALATIQPTDGTERWCLSNVPNLDVTIDGFLVTRTINITAVKEIIQVTTTPPIGAGTFEYYAFTVVPPGPVTDTAGNEVRITPWWSKSENSCPGTNPGIILSAFPVTPNTTYKRTVVLVLANW